MDIDATMERWVRQFLPTHWDIDFGLRMFSFARDSNRQVAGQPWSIGAHLTYVSDTLIGGRYAALSRRLHPCRLRSEAADHLDH